MNFHFHFDWPTHQQEGHLYRLKNINWVRTKDQDDVDQIGLCQIPADGTCSGVTQWISVGSKIKSLIRRINPTQTIWDGTTYTTDDKIQWAVWERPGGLMYAPSGDRDSSDPWWEFSIVIGSKDLQPGNYNVVRVLEVVGPIDRGGYARIARLPVLDNYDAYSPETTPEYFHRVWCTAPSGNVNESPKGTFWMPVVDAFGRQHAVGENQGWLRTEYLADRIS